MLDNLGWKVLALALAAFLWFTVSGQRRQRISERGYVVPLTVVNLPADMVIASALPDSVDVRLRGPFDAIRLADPAKMETVMDLTDTRPGERIYKLSEDDVNSPEDLTVVGISPAAVRVRLERLAQKEVRIVARFAGAPPALTASVDPGTARIAGPESEVAKIDSIPTDFIALPERRADFTVRATLASEPRIRILDPRGVVTVRVRYAAPE